MRLLAEKFAPAKLSGVTSLQHHHTRAREYSTRLHPSDRHRHLKLSFFCFPVELLARTSLDSSQFDLAAGDAATALDRFPAQSVDALFALDCAYQ